MVKRRERRDAKEHREKILQQAKVLFQKYGVDAVNMHQIAKSAGIGQGTLYRRYANKGELCRDMMSDKFQRLFVEIDTYLKTQTEAPARDKLVAIIKMMIRFVEKRFSMLEAVVCQGSPGMIYQSENYQKLHTILLSLLNEGCLNPSIEPRDLRLAADALIASLAPDFYHFLRVERKLDEEDILQWLSRTYVDRFVQ